MGLSFDLLPSTARLAGWSGGGGEEGLNARPGFMGFELAVDV